MDRLPRELVAEIASHIPEQYLDHPDGLVLPLLATLSRSWQYAIETSTFQSLTITSDDLDNFYSAFTNNTTRRRFLRHLQVDIILPWYTDADCAKYETATDRAENDDVFGRCLTTLLQELSRWPADGKLDVVIDMYSLMDGIHRGEDEFNHDNYEVSLGLRQDLFSERFVYSYIRFACKPAVVIPCVTLFDVGPGRKMDPGDQVALMAAFPNLEGINWSYCYPQFFMPFRRQQMRDLCNAVAEFEPQPSCETVHVYIDSPWYSHKMRLPNLISEGNSFCATLCTMLSRSSIELLDYNGPIDPSLFWYQQPPETANPCSWKSLREISIQFPPDSFAGQWYFKDRPVDGSYDPNNNLPDVLDVEGLLPPGHHESDEENKRAVALARTMEFWTDVGRFAEEGYKVRYFPRDEAMLPLLAAVARRLAHEPSLQNVYLEATIRGDHGAWFFEYQAPGVSNSYDGYMDREGSGCDDPLSRARVFLHVGHWRPDEEILAMLRRAGKDCHGEDAIITFLPSLF